MKKNKLTLISMIVFLTVFSLTALFEIQLPFHQTKGTLSKSDDVVLTKSDSLAEETQENEIKSFSLDITQGPVLTSQNPDTNDQLTGPTDQNSSNNNTTDSNSQEDATASDSKTASEKAVTASAKDTSSTDEIKSASEEASTKVKKAKYANIGISVAKDYVNVREKASTDSSILGKLYKDSAAEILDTKDDWYYIESGSVKGYVKREFIKTGIPDEELVEKYGTLSISVEVDGLNVRTEPTTDAKKVTVIYKDETYPVVNVKDDWVEIKITDEKVSGFVKSEFADLLVEFKEAVSKDEEEKLKQLAAEERAKKETEIKHQEAQDYTISDLELLSCLIQAEAGSQSYEGKLAVANVVLNRIKSSKYPDTMKAVIYQSGQFSVAHSGSLQKQLDNYHNYDSKLQLLSIKAAKDALAGANNIGSRMYFHSYRAAVRKGYDNKSTAVKIGALLFW